MALSGFDPFPFSHAGATRSVYRLGSGPGVVVMHEIPGITPQVAAFARRVADAGFSVALPHLFGTPGKPLSAPYALGQMVKNSPLTAADRSLGLIFGGLRGVVLVTILVVLCVLLVGFALLPSIGFAGYVGFLMHGAPHKPIW